MDNLGVIAQELAANAGEILSGESVGHRDRVQPLLPTVPAGLEQFKVGALGNFPYEWENPSNLLFNAKTYKWIRASLEANTTVVKQGGIFTNYYTRALGSISYGLSTTDQGKLNEAQQKTVTQQGALLRAWRAAFGSIPKATDTQQPIDIIMKEITQTWASPPTTLTALQQTSNLEKLLNTMPPSGQSVLPALANYLNALGNSISLLNATTMNTGYLHRTLAAVQDPSIENGGLMTDDGEIQPAYTVSPSVQDILNGLNSTDKKKVLTLKMSVARSSSTEHSVSIKGRTPVNVPIAKFFKVATGGNDDFFEKQIATDANLTEVNVTFTGVTMVFFGPVPFSLATCKNWFWPTPIRDAIKNGIKDVSGFKFSPNPQINFSKSGPFGYLIQVAISKNPSFTIETKGPNYKKIARDILAADSVKLTFLNRPMGSMSALSKDPNSVVTNDIDNSVKLNFRPSAALDDDTVDSTAFVLGVQTNYPAAGAG